MRKYKVSVIIAIYNVANYLEEAIDSVLGQTIGFKENIQMILVNDGSKDNSEDICLKYQKLYPQNIIYIKQENAGVSAARNHGLKYAQGEFINFLDGDDKWEKNVFEKVYKMFKQNDDIDIIGVRQKFFEASDNYHALDYKFDKDKIVDIFNNYNHIQLSACSAFIRFDSINNVRFDENLKYSEDFKFLGEIIIKKCKMGFIASSLYFYRKRIAQTSAVQTKAYNNDWYIETPKLCYKYLFELSKEKFGYVIEYFQYSVMYDYQWRAKEKIPDIIPEQIIKKYLLITKELLQEINDEIILEQKFLHTEYKTKLLEIKHGKEVFEKLKYNKHALYFEGKKCIDLYNQSILNISVMKFIDDKIIFKGLINTIIPKSKYEIFAVINGKEKIKLEIKDTKIYNRKIFNQTFITNKAFELIIPIKQFKKMHFEFVYDKYFVTKMNFRITSSGKLDNKIKLYYIKGEKIYYYYNKQIKAENKNIINIIKFKLKYLKQLLYAKKIKIIIVRNLYYILKFFKKKKIWIISDRPPIANDNGYAFFKYVSELKNKKIKTYFVISKDSQDFDKVRKTGKVLIYNSLKYKLYFLLADKIISSQADGWVMNAFDGRQCFYRDLYNADFIFLQHGILKDDLSIWLNCYEKNINIFVTSAQDEYNSILKGDYGYKEDVVKLTGLPRYDLLENKTEKLIAFMPTWRKEYAGSMNQKKGIRDYNISFKNTEYFKFYNNLINDNKLLQKMKEKGYKGIFVVHPSHVNNAKDFEGNDIIKVEDGLADYSNIFSKASLLVSDYSSVPFDFAYLNKPVIYTQFDKEHFFRNHMYTEGYFSYEDNGFGPVVYDYDTTVNTIIEYIENECKLDKEYEKRIKNFYEYRDKKNCERVYKEIINIS